MNLKLHSQGTEVEILQSQLNQLGSSLTVDGDFGPLTLLAVQAFQSKHFLTVDGIVGPITQAAITAALGGVIVPPNQISKGIDCYHGDDITSWTAIKNAGFDFVFMKATDGTTYVDPAFKTRWAQVEAAGLIRGAYLFWESNKDPYEQAHLFTKIVGKLSPADHPCFLDWESPNGASNSSMNSGAEIILDIIQNETGKCPLIYGSYGQLAEYQVHATLAKYPLWVADLRTGEPRIPSPWAKYTYHQYSFTAQVPGVGNACDVNKFNGTLDQLKQFIADSAV